MGEDPLPANKGCLGIRSWDALQECLPGFCTPAPKSQSFRTPSHIAEVCSCDKWRRKVVGGEVAIISENTGESRWIEKHPTLCPRCRRNPGCSGDAEGELLLSGTLV